MNFQHISSKEAYDFILKDSAVFVFDVRTSEEWEEIGIVDIDQSKIILRSLHNLETFLDIVSDVDKDIDHDIFLNLSDSEKKFCEFITSPNKDEIKILFLCRSGSRSATAACIAADYGFKAYNILDGFEGGRNGLGWKMNNLPWKTYNN